MIDFSKVDVGIVAAFGIEMEKLFGDNQVAFDYYGWGDLGRWQVYLTKGSDCVGADREFLEALRKLAVELAAAQKNQEV